MDSIKIGLDFGTHQTKICVQTTPDEGHGQPRYEFFTFIDLDGNSLYFLPSIIQINKDDTLSYGFVDPSQEKDNTQKPLLDLSNVVNAEFNIQEISLSLYQQYATESDTSEDQKIIEKMLAIRKEKLENLQKQQIETAEKKYQEQLKEYAQRQSILRYFKQATFSDRKWNYSIDQKTASIWYLSYILFLLEEKYGTNFSINMGVPADDKTFENKKRLAAEILLSAYHLVEIVYENDKEAFLSESIDNLLKKTKYISYSKDDKDEFVINIFPEAYASLVSLASRGKISTGMSLTADIGGGTTDISFFTIQNNKPVIYKYWSIPRGLNYIAEESGFDYSEGNFSERVQKTIVDQFNQDKTNIVNNFIKELARQFKQETGFNPISLHHALNDRVLVYNGGGSTVSELTNEIRPFTDVTLIDASMWREENVKDKAIVSRLSQLLSTAYGLSIGDSDEDVQLSELSSLFSNFASDEDDDLEDNYIDKDMC